jgi:PP-loop superfamily ATP-utilizing enzyme
MIHIISFSSGCGSAIAAEMAVNKYGSDNVLLLFADSLMEDESLYKFNKQVSI